MADPPSPPVVREVKRLLSMNITRSVSCKQRRLSPPRDPNALRQLVSSVLGNEIQPAVTKTSSIDHHSNQEVRFMSPLMVLRNNDSQFRENAVSHRLQSPQWSPELHVTQRKTKSLITSKNKYYYTLIISTK
jgi:hypothetical protein